MIKGLLVLLVSECSCNVFRLFVVVFVLVVVLVVVDLLLDWLDWGRVTDALFADFYEVLLSLVLSF